ncbi:MAG: hypothetical protein QGI34_08935, partial [Candidatus Latescibacteria bacterium]|nr:hypothetical protein [Candidatus Latescibacterota bacterium]
MMGSINGVERVEVVRRSRRWSDPSIIGQGSQPFKSITYSVFGEFHLGFQEGAMRPVVRAAEITIHKSDKIVAYGDPGISLWNQPNFTGGTMSEIPCRMGMKNPILTQDIHPAMSFIANI